MVGSNVVYSGTLGDDPKYQSGISRSAKFTKSHVDPGSGKTVVDVKISLAGSPSGIKVNASGKLSAFQAPLLADQFAGQNGPINSPLPAGTVQVQLGAYTDENSGGLLVGSASVKEVTKNNQPFELDSVKIKAAPAP